MRRRRASARWRTAILCGACGTYGLIAGCQVYLSGGPGGDRTPPVPAGKSAVERHADTASLTAAAPESARATGESIDAAPAPPPPRPRRGGAATFPGEQYYRAGRTWVVLDAVEEALEARDFHILRSGASARGGEVHAEQREQVATPPRTTASEAWLVRAAVIRVTGSTWEDCCYVKAAFTTTRVNSRGDVLGTTTADEPENHMLRRWFLDDLATRIPPPPAD